MNSQGPQNARLYVGGLNISVQQKDVEDLFAKYGKIIEIKMTRNFAFVQFSDESEAQAALKELNGTQHFGRRIDVQVARVPKGGPSKDDNSRDRSPIRGGGGGGRGSRGGGGMGMGGGRGGFRGGDSRSPFNNSRGSDSDFGSGPDFRGGRGDGGPFGTPFRGGGGPADFRGRDRPDDFGGDFGDRTEPPFRGNDSFGGRPGTDGFGGGRDFSLAPPTGFRDSPGGPGKFGGGGWGGGGSGLNDKAFDRPREAPPMLGTVERPPTHPPQPASTTNDERTNDIEIIVVDKTLTDYGEMIERRMSSLGFSVDVLFPHEAVPLARVLANIASRGTLYAVVVNHVHQINRSLTLHILHGRPQEHRNMAIEDAVTLLLRNYESYTKACRERGGPSSTPEQVRHLLTQILNGRQLTATQYDILVQFLIQEKMKLEPQANSDSTANAQQAELQTRILSILNKTPGVGGGGGLTDSMMGGGLSSLAPPPQGPGPLLQDPSIQKALDNLIQGGDLLRQIAPQPPAFNRY